jgi:hypothetical protein
MGAELEGRASLAGITVRALRSRDEHAAPTAALLDMNQFDGIRVREGIEDALDLV